MTREEATAYINKQEPTFLQRAKKIGYVCPVCGNGAGSDGTGITKDPKSGRHHCFKCSLHASVIDLYAQYKGVEVDRELFDDVYNYYGLTIDEEQSRKSTKSNKKNTKATAAANNTAKKSASDTETDYTNYFYNCRDNLFKIDSSGEAHYSGRGYEYLKGRGISDEIIRKFLLGYDIERDTIVIPTSRTSYNSRSISDKKFYKPKGVRAEIFNYKALTSEKTTMPIYVTEAEFDALSIESVGGIAIALGGTSNVNKLIEHIKEDKPIQPLIICLDRDEAGEMAKDKLIKELKSLKIPYHTPDLKVFYYGKKDANEALTDNEAKQWLEASVSDHNKFTFETVAELKAKDPDSWKEMLMITKNGEVVNNRYNTKLIFENDENLKGIVYNDIAGKIEIRNSLPWRKKTSSARMFWRDADDSQLIFYLDETYNANFSDRNLRHTLVKVADDRRYHPIEEFLDNLPEWDGTSRLERLFVDYLGAEDNEYIRAVTRKTFAAAISRIYNPGIKFDSMLILDGPQDIGKSTLIRKMSGDEWFTDSVSVNDMNDLKNAAEKIQGKWLIEFGEMAGMKKADVEKVKSFITSQDDNYRPAYGKNVESHPRQCVFFGTVNGENGYLRDTTGNRRFWIVKVSGKTEKKPWDLTQDEVTQLWAEAMHYYNQGEKLYLEGDLKEFAKKEQAEAMEYDEREGLVREYLDKMLPKDWDKMSIPQKLSYINSPKSKGEVRRETVSNIEIWTECFGKNKVDMTKRDSYDITAIMQKINEWNKSANREYILGYGRQRVYKRKKMKPDTDEQ